MCVFPDAIEKEVGHPLDWATMGAIEHCIEVHESVHAQYQCPSEDVTGAEHTVSVDAFAEKAAKEAEIDCYTDTINAWPEGVDTQVVADVRVGVCYKYEAENGQWYSGCNNE